MIQLTDKLAVAVDETLYVVGEPREWGAAATGELAKKLFNGPIRNFQTMKEAVNYAIKETLRLKLFYGEITTMDQYNQTAGELMKLKENFVEV